jgi:acetolactate synthase-1/2/3 large subunit
LAQAEVTGRPGACLTTLGPGAASAVNGVACAYLERAPLVVFTDSHPDTFAHQRLDHHALMRPITKWSARLTADTGVETLDRALALAAAAPAGPVHLDCPADVLAVDVSRSGLDRDRGLTRVRPLADGLPDPAAAQSGFARQDDARMEALLARARKPLLIVGLGARRPEDADAIRRLCARRGVPAMVTYKAKGVVPDDHPLFAGVFTNGTIEEPLIAESDLLIGIGLDPVELIPRNWTRAQPIVAFGPYPVEVRHVPFVAAFVAPIPACLEYLDATLHGTDWRVDVVRGAVADARRRIQAPLHALTADAVVRVAADRLAGPARVAVDAGAHMFPATMLWPVRAPNEMLISNGLSTMGFALPAAIGAALVDRSRPVVALTGDGGLLMCAGELLTAARVSARVIVIVFSDRSLSLIEVKQQLRRYDPAGVEPSLIEAKIDRSNYGRMLAAIRG